MKIKRWITAYGHFNVAAMFPEICKENVTLRHSGFDFKPGDCLIIEGGTDVDPARYGDKRGKYTQGTDYARDNVEFELVEEAVAAQIPILGVCRGAQLLCVAAGGSLIQHVNGHGGADHPLHTIDDEWEGVKISTCHHQMMYPWNVQHEILAYTLGRSDVYLDGGNNLVTGIVEEEGNGSIIEPEIVFFPQIGGLAIQGHPEFMDINSPGVAYCSKLIQEWLQ